MGWKWIEPTVLLGLSIVAVLEGLRVISRYTTTFGSVQAGGYLILLGAVLGFLTVFAWFTGNLGLRKSQNSKNDKRRIPKQVVICLLILAGSSLCIPWLGYMLSTILFFLAYFMLLGGYRWVPALLYSIALGITFAVIFAKAGMMLPQGLIPWP